METKKETLKRIIRVKKENLAEIKRRLLRHLTYYWASWLLFFFMLIVAFFFEGRWKTVSLLVLMALFVLALVRKPMNIIHGLIGTRGDIKIFIKIFLVLNVVFSLIYYFSFFKDAGITYDMSQPHVEFNMFDTIKGKSVCVPKDCRMEMIPENGYDDDSGHYYHKIGYVWVLQNTFLTSLMQEPTEFYSFSCTYNGNYHKEDLNRPMANCFHWFLVFHIMISWILLGVFISLIYQKFRNS